MIVWMQDATRVTGRRNLSVKGKASMFTSFLRYQVIIKLHERQTDVLKISYPPRKKSHTETVSSKHININMIHFAYLEIEIIYIKFS